MGTVSQDMRVVELAESLASSPAPEAHDGSQNGVDAQSLAEQSTPSPRTSGGEFSSARAWLIVLGSWCFFFPTWGFMTCVGTIQAYLQSHQLAAYSTRDVGWITGTYTALSLLLGLQVGPWVDAWGPKVLAPAGAALLIPVFFVLAECSKYWHFMLVLGFWASLGTAVQSTVAAAVVAKWFKLRRGLAMGIALTGASVSGVAMPLMLRSLFPRVGWATSIRAFAGVEAVVMVVGAACLYQDLPSSPSQPLRLRKAALDFGALRSPTFVMVTIGLMALEWAMFVVLSLLPTYAQKAGYPSNVGFVLIAAANGVSTFGRLLPGLAGDYLGHFNVLICMILLAVIITGAILVPFGSTSLAALYAFSALWGIGSGSFMSLSPVCMGRTCEPEDYGRYFGTMYFFVSFALLVATPTGGQMLETSGTQGLAYLLVGLLVLGGVCFLFARQLLYGLRRIVIMEKV